jgi:hypothetical protein
MPKKVKSVPETPQATEPLHLTSANINQLKARGAPARIIDKLIAKGEFVIDEHAR